MGEEKKEEKKSNDNNEQMVHDYNTRFNNNISKPQSKRSWGQHRFVCHAVDDWTLS